MPMLLPLTSPMLSVVHTPDMSEDFFEWTLAQVEETLLDRGWSRSFTHLRLSQGNRCDLEGAIDVTALFCAEYALGDELYSALARPYILAAELKAYLCTFLPYTASINPDLRPSLLTFNDNHKTSLADILELLHLAREAWRPINLGYRIRHNRPEIYSAQQTVFHDTITLGEDD